MQKNKRNINVQKGSKEKEISYLEGSRGGVMAQGGRRAPDLADEQMSPSMGGGCSMGGDVLLYLGEGGLSLPLPTPSSDFLLRPKLCNLNGNASSELTLLE